MKTRIDHALVVTPRDKGVAVLDDCSIEFEGGVVTRFGQTRKTVPIPARAATKDVRLPELHGRPLGAILFKLGLVTHEEVVQALERQKTRHGVIGQILMELACVTEGEVEFALAIQAGRGATAEPDREVTVIDGRGTLVTPGLVNTHHHLFQSLTRCRTDVQAATLFSWLTTLYPIWRGLCYDDLRQAAAVSLAELVVSGCTTTSDHHYLFPSGSDARLEAILEAAEQVGIRIHACRGSMSMGRSAGGLPPDECVENEKSILADCQHALLRFHDARPMSMRRIDLAPCSPFNITPELLDETRVLAAEHHVLLHTHAAETLDEERFCLERFQVRPIEYLRRHEWLADNVYLAHCVHLNDQEIRLLAETHTGVAHCPSSNMRLASGVAPIRKMLDAGVKVGLAVDGSSSNDGGSILAEARQALLLQRVGGNPAGMTAEEAFRLVTAGGAGVLNRDELGRIEPGCAADLALFDLSDVAFAGAIAQDPIGALILAQPPRPRDVFVAGKRVVEAGRICTLDGLRLVADFNRLVQRKYRA
ncbi:MAG TPA: 8-oxoguanine deaminase [Phycisphaerae bacterium]|nr:8-oxoguanine deaminase [Phycisphaerae bacterium]HRY71138.1 8-oxoguanine deaminase [Phycisphaerae bacterium]